MPKHINVFEDHNESSIVNPKQPYIEDESSFDSNGRKMVWWSNGVTQIVDRSGKVVSEWVS